MTAKELKQLLEKVPDDYIVWDYCCVREIESQNVIIDTTNKLVGYEN